MEKKSENKSEFNVNLTQEELFNEAFKKAVSETDVDYVSNSVYPFIQLINPRAEFGEKFNLRFVKTANGWIIHNYGEAISAAAPHTQSNVNASSVSNQIVVAKEIAKIISDNKWPAAELVAGTPMMKFLLWAKAEEAGLDWFGYEPDEKDRKRFELLVKNGLIKKEKAPRAAITTTAV